MSRERRQILLDRFERATEIPLLLLSIGFLVILFAIESGIGSAEMISILEGLLWLIWGMFGIELVIKFYLAPDRRQYLRSHWIEVLIIALPFLRPLRLLWLPVILARLWRQSRRALRQRMPALIGIASLIIVLTAATLMFVAERGSDGPINSFADAVWWAITTITTVGYGDTYPVTAMGRGVAVFLMLAGISLFGLLTANIAAFFVEEDADDRTQSELAQINQRLERIEQLLAILSRPTGEHSFPAREQ
ncbi:potassium channel family protein [Chloroflexus sp.]|uniref:potassium channel family protein n=1 Tax=Chloroflexus sp. TaxID=1904827 RepID=UPI002623D177|nr:potassium channel family protein [uncultured Chloroflexus sp.]